MPVKFNISVSRKTFPDDEDFNELFHILDPEDNFISEFQINFIMSTDFNYVLCTELYINWLLLHHFCLQIVLLNEPLFINN